MDFISSFLMALGDYIARLTEAFGYAITTIGGIALVIFIAWQALNLTIGRNR